MRDVGDQARDHEREHADGEDGPEDVVADVTANRVVRDPCRVLCLGSAVGRPPGVLPRDALGPRPPILGRGLAPVAHFGREVPDRAVLVAVAWYSPVTRPSSTSRASYPAQEVEWQAEQEPEELGSSDRVAELPDSIRIFEP